VEQTFLYHALATGVSGHITAPFQHVIAVQAPSALPFIGGYSSSRVEGFRHDQILSFAAAESSTTGSENREFFNTLATANIERLNIHNVLTADRVVARLASKYSKETGERTTTFAGSHFENLRIGGCPIEVRIDPERLESSSRSERGRFGTFAAPVSLERCFGVELLEDGALHVFQFGKVYLAECLSTASYASISMLRVVLGCAVEGHVAAANASSNGEPMPGRIKP
jgi:hypothetical protein